MARPSKFTEQLGAVIVRGVSVGLPVKTAAAVAGVSSSTVFEWLKRKPDFRQRVARARGELASEAWQTLWKAGSKDWRAAAKWLELIDPQQWGER